jgi:hypothetical protein
MMLNDKRFISYGIICALYFLAAALLFAATKTSAAAWYSIWFFDKFYVFQYSVFYLIGCSMVDRYFNSLTCGRFESRKKVIFERLANHYCFAVSLTSLLFVYIVCGAALLYEDSLTVFGLADLLDRFLRRVLGALLLSNISVNFALSNKRAINVFPQICVFVIITFEVLILVPTLRRNTPIDANILFSWVFEDKGFVNYVWLITIVQSLGR